MEFTALLDSTGVTTVSADKDTDQHQCTPAIHLNS